MYSVTAVIIPGTFSLNKEVKKVNKLNYWLGNIEKMISSVTLTLVTLLVSFLVLNRNIFHVEIMGINDLCIYLYVISLYAGIAYTTKEGGHSAVEVISIKLKKESPKYFGYYSIFCDIYALITVIIFLSPVFFIFKKAIQFPEHGVLITWFNQSWLVYVMFVTFCICAFHLIINIYHKYDCVKKGKMVE